MSGIYVEERDEDAAYDEHRQRLVDAYTEGQMAGEKGLPEESCPYFSFEPEANEWHLGRFAAIEAKRIAA